MRLMAFPGCCGITILCEFPCASSMGDQTLRAGEKEEIELFLRKNIKERTGVGMLMIALNEIQIKAGIEDIVRREGFKRVKKPAYHPGHQRCIGVYTFELHPERRKEIPLRKKLFS